MVEGCAEGADLVLEGRLNDGPAVEGGLALCVSGVEDMYRFISVRGAERRDGYCGVARGSLGNAPDDANAHPPEHRCQKTDCGRFCRLIHKKKLYRLP